LSALSVLNEAVENQLAVTLHYNNEDRLVSPTAVQHVESTGNTILVGLEPNKGWRKYILDNVSNVEVSQLPHVNVDEIDISSFVEAMLDEQ
jgi:hypothetical protein